MNVLLAEANVPYPQLKEMEEINPEFPRADVALVIGANDVTNPAARRPGTAISGMPILDVDQAKSIIVIKRSMGHGYAGIDNELYTDPKTSMYFADAKTALAELTSAVKAYNETVGSYEARVVPAARRFEDHGAASSGREVPALEQVTVTARRVEAVDDDDTRVQQLQMRRLRAAE